MSCSFPALGQVIKFAYDATGVLPRKRGDQDDLTDQQKKTVQKQLERLIAEKGSLSTRLGGLIHDLAFIVAGTVENERVNLAIGEGLLDLFEVYNKVVCNDGTFLDEARSIQWICRAYAIPRLAFSIPKQLLRFNIGAQGLSFPGEPDWFLPTLEESRITWPLTKAMRWIYHVCDTTQTHFHYPGKNVREVYPEQQRNLENAADWSAGKRLPSWPGLRWNFSKSMDRLESIEDPSLRRDIPEALRESIMHVLFLARLSTFVCRAILDAYGPAFLGMLVNQFQRHSLWLAPELHEFREQVTAYIGQAGVPPESIDQVWFLASKAYWASFADLAILRASVLQARCEIHDGVIPEEERAELVANCGDHAFETAVEQWVIAREFMPPEGFAEAFVSGMSLRTNPDCTAEDVDGYVEGLRRTKLESLLPWVGPWLHALVCYRREDYEAAFHYIEDAFERAKYCAGAHQSKLVNRYIELAAKTDRWTSFKSGVEWARYLGISVRLLRDEPLTDDSLRAAFALMKRMQYL